jgi:large subunit ribosomal protein L4
MANVLPILTRGGGTKGNATLPESLFAVEPNEHVMYEAVRSYLANQRSGTANTRGRSEVRGGGRKPWRQKGTGRARVGSIRVSHWVGGGTTFGPKPRDMSVRLPKKIKRLALKSALSTKAGADEIRIIEDLKLDKISTKEIASMLKEVGAGSGRTLLVIPEGSREILLSSRNIPHVKVTLARQLDTYSLLEANTVVMTESALAKVEEVFGE